MTDHPITPPPELVDRWLTEWAANDDVTGPQVEYVATQAARWGADQELEACIFWLIREGWFGSDGTALQKLRAARRPKPPSLKQQALTDLDSLENMGVCNADTIRRALESLPD